MPNRFNTPIQSRPTQNYTSQYVGLPLDEMEASLQASQSRYDQIEALGTTKKSELAGIEAQGEWASQTLAKKRKELDDFTSQYDGKDLGSQEVSSAFKQKISDLSEDPDVNKIIGFNQKYKMFKANLEKMKESGDYTPENIWQHQKALENYSKSGDDSGFDPLIEKGVNIEEEAEKYFKPLHANSIETMRKIADGQGGSIYYDNQSSGISGQQVYNQAGRMLKEFANSAAGRQATRRYQMEVESNGGKATQQGANQYLAKTLLNAGAGFAYSESKSGLSAALDKSEDLKRKKKDEKEMITLPFTTASTLTPNIKVGADRNIVGEGGAIEAFKQHLESNQGDWKGAFKEFKQVAFGNKANPLSDAQRKAYAPTLDAYKEANKGRKQPYDLGDWLQKASQGAKEQQITLNVPLKKETQESWQNLLVDHRGIMGLTLIDPKDPTKSITGEQAIRLALDKSPKDDLEQKDIDEAVQILGGSNITGYALDGVGVSIGDKPYLADMGTSKMLPFYKPKSQAEINQINAFGIKQAKLKNGSHIFYGADNQGNRIKVKAIPDIMSGTVKTIQLKDE